MGAVPTAERSHGGTHRAALAVLLIASVAVLLGVMTGTSGAKECPPGLLRAADIRTAPGIGHAPGLPDSNSPVLPCLGEIPVTTSAPTTEAPTTTVRDHETGNGQPPEVLVPEPAQIIPPAEEVAPEPQPEVVVVPPAAKTVTVPHAVTAVPRHPTTTLTTVTEAPLELAFTPEPDPGPVVRRRVRAAAVSPVHHDDRRPLFVASIPRPGDVSWNLGHVGANASLALALVLLLGLPAEVLNSSLKTLYGNRKRATKASSRLARLEARVNRLPDPLLLVGFGVASAIVYSQLDPGVGLDGRSVLFVAALASALIIVTGLIEAVRIPYLRRRHQVGSHLQMFPKAFGMAVILVVLSRLTGFHPGFIFGVTCGLAVSGRLRDEDEGRSIAVACAGLLLLAAGAWIAWIPAASAAAKADASGIAILLDTFLATLWVTGLQVVLFGLLPVRFLYGEKVLRWSRTGWLALYGTAMFLFVQTLFHPQAGEWGGFSNGMMWLIGGAGLLLLVAASAFWVWVQMHPPAVIDLADEPDPADGSEGLVLVG